MGDKKIIDYSARSFWEKCFVEWVKQGKDSVSAELQANGALAARTKAFGAEPDDNSPGEDEASSNEG